MICNLSKCKELVVRKKNNKTQYEQICNIPQYNSLSLLGVTLQSNCKFSENVRQKLVKANRYLHVLRSLRKEQYSQVETDHLFKSLVLPNFTYCLSVYGASEPVVATSAALFLFPFPLRIFYIDRNVRF